MSALAKLLSEVLHRTRNGPERVTVDVESALGEAVACLSTGDHDRAHALCGSVLECDPANARAHHLVGAILVQRQDYASAMQSLRRALAVDPQRADAWVDLGNVLRISGTHEESLECYARALQIEPRHVLAAYGQSQLLAKTGHEQEAIGRLEERIVLDYHPLLLRTLVGLLVKQSRFEAARRVCDQALASDPHNAEAHSGAGFLALTVEQDPVRALVHFDRAITGVSDDADLFSNRGIALQELGRVDDAVRCYEKALALDPQHRSSRIHHALGLLLSGDYERGWKEYEYRRLADDWGTPPDGVPEWQGEDLGAKSIYVYAEQGIGDEILFASCIPDLVRCSARVMLECDPRLMSIFARSFPGIAVYSRVQRLSGAQSPRRMGADFMVPMGSMPRHFRPHAQSFSTREGYLHADEGLTAAIRTRLASLSSGRLRVGISWRGGTRQTGAAVRSISLEDLLPMLQIPEVSWVSVQYGDVTAEIAALHEHHGICVHEFPEALRDYEQTAALACALDLVISVQTAIVNLCGALGRPVWVGVPLNPHWRYGPSAESMPWYASVRVIRQTARGNWSDVIAEMQKRLHDFAPQVPITRL